MVLIIAAIFGLISAKLACCHLTPDFVRNPDFMSSILMRASVSYFNYKDTLKLLAMAFLGKLRSRAGVHGFINVGVLG
jgi:hypothetical protein